MQQFMNPSTYTLNAIIDKILLEIDGVCCLLKTAR